MRASRARAITSRRSPSRITAISSRPPRRTAVTRACRRSRSLRTTAVGPARSARLRPGQLHAQRCAAGLSRRRAAAVSGNGPASLPPTGTKPRRLCSTGLRRARGRIRGGVGRGRGAAPRAPRDVDRGRARRRHRPGRRAGLHLQILRCTQWRARAAGQGRTECEGQAGNRAAAPNDKRMQGRLGEDAGQQNTAAAPPAETEDRAGKTSRAGRAGCGRSRSPREGTAAGSGRAACAGRGTAVHARRYAGEHGAAAQPPRGPLPATCATAAAGHIEQPPPSLPPPQQAEDAGQESARRRLWSPRRRRPAPKAAPAPPSDAIRAPDTLRCCRRRNRAWMP